MHLEARGECHGAAGHGNGHSSWGGDKFQLRWGFRKMGRDQVKKGPVNLPHGLRENHEPEPLPWPPGHILAWALL